MMKSEHGRIDLLIQKQIDWCDEYCDFLWFVKDDGKVYSEDDRIFFKNKETIDSFFVDFGDCKDFKCYLCILLKSLKGASKSISGDFDCSHCDSLESLEGAPKNILGNFFCFYCESLKSLKGAPESVGGNFNCAYSKSLGSLKGAPENVGGDFNCHECNSLKSLEGSSKSVGENFKCYYCESLKSLEGVPDNIGKNFYCFNCKLLKSIDGLKNMKMKGKIYHSVCPKLKKYDFILNDMNVFKMWQRSTCSADEFLKEYNGFLQAKKYGI